jgi:AraC-like DNA-binding protein
MDAIATELVSPPPSFSGTEAGWRESVARAVHELGEPGGRMAPSPGGRCAGAPPSSLPGLTDRQAEQVLEFIRMHLSEELSLEVLARQVGFSRFHFTRLFRQALGVSPHQVVLRQRIEHAQRLLAETALPLARIAGACGFANQSHFTHAFKRALGMPPRAYRRERADGAGAAAISSATVSAQPHESVTPAPPWP